jgi:hypothetical protein
MNLQPKINACLQDELLLSWSACNLTFFLSYSASKNVGCECSWIGDYVYVLSSLLLNSCWLALVWLFFGAWSLQASFSLALVINGLALVGLNDALRVLLLFLFLMVSNE